MMVIVSSWRDAEREKVLEKFGLFNSYRLKKTAPKVLGTKLQSVYLFCFSSRLPNTVTDWSLSSVNISVKLRVEKQHRLGDLNLKQDNKAKIVPGEVWQNLPQNNSETGATDEMVNAEAICSQHQEAPLYHLPPA